MRLKSALRRGVAAAVIAGIVVSSGIPAYAKTWDIADGDITVKGASDESGNYNEVKQGETSSRRMRGRPSSPASRTSRRSIPSPSTPPRATWTSPSTT